MEFDKAHYRGILERIEQVREEEGFQRVKHFTDTINYSYAAYINLQKKDARKPSVELVASVLYRFPKYCFNWLVLKKGPKIADGKNDSAFSLEKSQHRKIVEKNLSDLMAITERQNSQLISLRQQNVDLRDKVLTLERELHEQNFSD